MRVILTEPTGFCFGVRRAVRLTEGALNQGTKDVYCLGPLIHNNLVVERLRQKGVRVIKRLSEADRGKVIIRTHGTQPDVLLEAKQKKIELLDATCPFVKSSQQIAKRLSEEGYQVVIAGDKRHPEIESLLGFSKGDTIVIEPGIKKLPVLKKRIGILAQTTCSKEAYLKLMQSVLKRDFAELRIFNTICDDTLHRQKAVLKLSCKVDLMLVIGGKNSANTKRLFQICRQTGVETHHIENAERLNPEWLKGKRNTGLASGASTPDWIVEEILKKIKK